MGHQQDIKTATAGIQASYPAKACVVPGGEGYTAEQGPEYVPGISTETTGSTVLWLGKISLQPGQRTGAHVHERHETAHYMLSGDEVELYTGADLAERQLVHPGDFVFIPANVMHVAVNRGGKPAVFIACRNEPTAQESVVMHSELDRLVP